MLKNQQYSDFNEEIKKNHRPKCSDYGVKWKNVKEIYKKRNQDIKETENREKYMGEGRNSDILYYFGGLFLLSSIISIFLTTVFFSIFLLFIGLLLCFFAKKSKINYDENVKQREDNYKSLEIFDKNMESFIKANDNWQIETDKIRIPLLKKMKKEIESYSSQDFENLIVNICKESNLKIKSINKKFEITFLYAEYNKYNIAIIIIPFNNPISGFFIQKLCNDLPTFINYVYIFAKFGEYNFGRGFSLFSRKPFNVKNSFKIAEIIWNLNTQYFKNENKIDNKNKQ